MGLRQHINMNLTQLLESKGIPVAGPGQKHFKSGWVHLNCPWCDDNKFHLGFSTAPVGRCFKCGRHGLTDTLKLLLRCTWNEARELSQTVCSAAPRRIEVPEVTTKTAVKLPAGSGPLLQRHQDYLQGRGFDPNEIEALWGVQGIGAVGDRPWSVVIPIFDEKGELATWQARDITGKGRSRYETCRIENGGADPKTLLYGLNLIRPESKLVIVTEGPIDTWRMGAGWAVATLGMDWSRTQLLTLAKRFETVAILFDNEPAAMAKGHELRDALFALGCEAIQGDLRDHGKKDAAELTNDEAEAIRQSLK